MKVSEKSVKTKKTWWKIRFRVKTDFEKPVNSTIIHLKAFNTIGFPMLVSVCFKYWFVKNSSSNIDDWVLDRNHIKEEPSETSKVKFKRVFFCLNLNPGFYSQTNWVFIIVKEIHDCGRKDLVTKLFCDCSMFGVWK